MSWIGGGLCNNPWWLAGVTVTSKLVLEMPEFLYCVRFAFEKSIDLVGFERVPQFLLGRC
jgi:hypothetical protein